MKTCFDCIPCFVEQSLALLRRAGVPEERIGIQMRWVLRELSEIDFNTSPPVTAARIHRAVRSCTNVPDPYAAEKKRYAEYAAELLPRLQAAAESSPDPFLGKVRLAIAANIIDFGKNSRLSPEDVAACLRAALDTPIDTGAVSRLRCAVDAARSILYLCDNAGEIVFDRLLIESMPCEKIVCAVRGSPVINDATAEDAKTAGLDSIVRIIPNGSDAPGTVLDECSEEFIKVFDYADLVISKGQGNFETLSDISGKRIFFLLQVKCPVVARDIGHPVGTFVVKEHFTGAM